MNRLILALLSCTPLLFSSTILSHQIYDRSDRVDVMLTFDTPYDGTLSQYRQSGKIVVKLGDATIDTPALKKLSSPFVSKLTITPIDQETQFIATVPDSVVLRASKTSDAYGLRLRFTNGAPAVTTSAPSLTSQQTAATSGLPTKPDLQISTSYYVVIGILVAGIIILLYLKRKISATASGGSKKPWLFATSGDKKADNVTIRFQKGIDQKNRVVMMDYGEESYLVVIGSTNLLLDKFHGNQPVTQSEFESMLQDKHEELDSFLQIDKQQQSGENRGSSLESYKQKASGIDYEA
jgi:hypothetical protein